MKLKNPVTQLENVKESLTIRVKQAEDRVLGLQDKGEDLEQVSKDYDTLQKIHTGKKHTRNVGYHEKPNLLIIA